jgi:hypothetical protein
MKMKIRRKILSSKLKVNNYLNNEKVTVVNDIEKDLLKLKLISVNFDEYLKKKINNKNLAHSIIISIICIIGGLRLLAGAFITDPKIWVLIADPFYLIGNRVLINLVLIVLIVGSLKFRLIYLFSKNKNFNNFL